MTVIGTPVTSVRPSRSAERRHGPDARTADATACLPWRPRRPSSRLVTAPPPVTGLRLLRLLCLPNLALASGRPSPGSSRRDRRPC